MLATPLEVEEDQGKTRGWKERGDMSSGDQGEGSIVLLVMANPPQRLYSEI